MNILVVEDSRTQAQYLRYILEEEGCQVSLATNGMEALRQIEKDRPDIVLTDIVMPEMDGYELCHTIKQNVDTKDIPVILVTQLFDPVDVIKGLEAGADNFIIKPYEPEYIHSRIKSTVLSLKNPDPDGECKSLEFSFSDGQHTITSSRLQIINILMSTYEIAVSKNSELEEAHERLNSLNEKLQEAVEDLKNTNVELQRENSERRRVEAALADANKKLQLMTNITRHDLLNQLTALREYIELGQIISEKDSQKAWSHITSACKVLEQIINTVRFTGEYQKIGIKSPVWQGIRMIVENSAKNTPMNHVVLENNLPEAAEIYADPLIEKVFINLIQNAVKYGGKITTISFSLTDEDGTTRILCRDDGIGIPIDEKEKIFTYEYGINTGLGLFLSREILAITGIDIRETGEPGKGACFEIICPSGSIRQPEPS